MKKTPQSHKVYLFYPTQFVENEEQKSISIWASKHVTDTLCLNLPLQPQNQDRIPLPRFSFSPLGTSEFSGLTGYGSLVNWNW